MVLLKTQWHYDDQQCQFLNIQKILDKIGRDMFFALG